MPDQTVQVTFTKATQQFTFLPDSVRMTSAGKVILNKSGGATWRFTGATVKSDTLGQFSTSIPGEGNVLQISDAVRDRSRTTYKYNVTVTQDGQTFTSPDPDIVNDPPGGP